MPNNQQSKTKAVTITKTRTKTRVIIGMTLGTAAIAAGFAGVSYNQYCRSNPTLCRAQTMTFTARVAAPSLLWHGQTPGNSGAIVRGKQSTVGILTVRNNDRYADVTLDRMVVKIGSDKRRTLPGSAMLWITPLDMPELIGTTRANRGSVRRLPIYSYVSLAGSGFTIPARQERSYSISLDTTNIPDDALLNISVPRGGLWWTTTASTRAAKGLPLSPQVVRFVGQASGSDDGGRGDASDDLRKGGGPGSDDGGRGDASDDLRKGGGPGSDDGGRGDASDDSR
jgi:hypothetical protein